MGVSEDNTDLGRSCSFLRKLADLIDDLLRSGLEPGRRGTRVGSRAGRYALSIGVHSTHLDESGLTCWLLTMFLENTLKERRYRERNEECDRLLGKGRASHEWLS
jgi:hypothetical protein